MSFFLRIFIVVILTLSSSLFGSIGKVSLLKGEAYAQRESQKISLQNGSTLEEKDIITTAKDAQIQFIFEDKTVITLGGESEFKIEEYFNDAKNPKAKFKFGQGSFKTITGQIGKTAPDNFTLETKTATIGIRGTIVAGSIPPPPPPPPPNVVPPPPAPEVIFCLSGSIFARPISNPTAPPVTIPAGSVTFSSPGAPPTPPRPATPQELQQINQSVGGTPPPPSPAGGNPPPSGNTPPTAGDNPPPAPSGGDTPPAPPPPAGPQSFAPAPQSFTPTSASGALQTNSQNLVQNLVVGDIAKELGVPVEDLKEQIIAGTPIIPPVVVPPIVPEIPPVIVPPIVVPPVVVPPVTPPTPPSGGGGGTVISTTKTVFVMAASDIMDGQYYYEPGKNITLDTETYTSIPFQGYDASTGEIADTYTKSLRYLSEFAMTYEYQSPQEVMIYGEKATALPTVGISTYISPVSLGSNMMQVNFANKKALHLNFDSSNNGVNILIGQIENSSTSLSGSVYDFSTSFTEKSAGTFVGQLFGTLYGSYGPSGIGLVGQSEDFYKDGSIFSSLGYSAGSFGGFLEPSKSSITDNTSGTMERSGLVTSRYEGNVTSINDSIVLNVDKFTGLSDGNITLSDARGSYALTQADANKSVYISDKYFAIVGFNGQESWLIGIPTGLEYVDGSRVSWGMWAVDEVDSNKMFNSSSYWVAGENEALAASHIISLANTSGTSYTYNGKAMGRVYDGTDYYRIDPYYDTTNAVRLKFNFGDGSPIDSSQSYIKFTVDTDKLWDINISGAATASGMFGGTLGGNRVGAAISGDINGSFYGTNAESIGGTFKATVPSGANGNYAMGVFVGTQTPATPSAPFALMGLTTASYLEFVDPYYYERFESYNDFILINANNRILGTISLFDGPNLDLNSTSVTNGDGTFMIANPHANITEISSISSPIADTNVSWGKWSSTSIDDNATLQESTNNFWVAGDTTAYAAAISHIAQIHASPTTYTSYTYEGKALGKVYDGEQYYAIDPNPVNDPFNAVKLKFKFGNSQAPIDSQESYIRFTAHGYWDIRVDPEYPATASPDGWFSANLSNGTYDETIFGYMDGYFYGANANSLGGTFNASGGPGNDDAFGVFIASKTLSETELVFSLTGLAISTYVDTNVTYSISDIITILAPDSSNIQAAVNLKYDNNTTRGTGEPFDLNGTGTISNIHDFNTTKIWTENSVANDYVSWGYWVSTEVDGNATLMANTQNFWVAGKDAAAAAAYIAGLNSETAPYYYLYQGQVLGSVIENGTAYGIDPANSAVTLKFDFGNTKAIIPSGSSISFTSSAPTNPSWKLIPDAAVVSGGKFTGTLTNDGTIMTTSATGTIKGQFFGTQAQGIGGTLKAIAGGSTAIGVFKGTGEMTLP